MTKSPRVRWESNDSITPTGTLRKGKGGGGNRSTRHSLGSAFVLIGGLGIALGLVARLPFPKRGLEALDGLGLLGTKDSGDGDFTIADHHSFSWLKVKRG
jgi:hypothetical protein